MSEKSCITINCGCCGGGSGNKGDGAPVGTVISYMGTKAPEHYLVCDGAVINIADYSYLADQIKAEFGAADYFGGDGTTTFAVPDLRNEFLRGYRGSAAEQLSGEVGVHQEPTKIANTVLAHTEDFAYHWIGGYLDKKESSINANMDIIYGKSVALSSSQGVLQTQQTQLDKPIQFASRPTNVAVLFCIKYE